MTAAGPGTTMTMRAFALGAMTAAQLGCTKSQAEDAAYATCMSSVPADADSSDTVIAGGPLTTEAQRKRDNHQGAISSCGLLKQACKNPGSLECRAELASHSR